MKTQGNTTCHLNFIINIIFYIYLIFYYFFLDLDDLIFRFFFARSVISELITSRYWINPAEVKKIEPTKKTELLTIGSCHQAVRNDGNIASPAPSVNNAEPIMNRIASHHEIDFGSQN